MIPRLTSQSTPASIIQAFRAELLARGFEGEMSFSDSDRVVLATDNSIYQLKPSAIVFPRSTDDLVRIAKVIGEARFGGVHVAPRGGGTGTNGQSLTDGVTVDLSRFMNKILHIDPEARTVRVQPGVVKDQLNAALKEHGLFFAPELSTSNRATIGGMISTDACGQGSCLYGKTRNHVLALKTVLADGSVLHSAPLSPQALTEAQQGQEQGAEIYRRLDALERDNAQLIAARFPKLNRSLTGYDLAHLRSADGTFDLNAVICGSEGTLGFIAEATLNVLPIPSHAALVNMRYDSFDAALRDAQALMALGPASIETIDSKVLALAQNDLVWGGVSRFLPADDDVPVQGVNLIEFVAHSQGEIDAALTAFEVGLQAQQILGRQGYTVARSAADVAKIWEMRKRSVGLLGGMQGEKRPCAFVEDTAVPPENLADFISDFRAILDRHGLDYGMFGHVDAGVLHVRPALDMKADGAEALVREITEEVAALALSYGGLLWGEHGKGVRSEFSPRFFGPLYPAIQSVKAAFDPRNQFNPGKLAAPEGSELLKIDGVPTKGQSDRRIPVQVREAVDNALHCNGNGACFNWDPDDAMCPSWKATRERRYSPKGRAQLMREWLLRLSESGVDPWSDARAMRSSSALWQLPRRIAATLWHKKEDFSTEVNEAMAVCLACKSCTGKCPIKVDVPAFRAKFLEVYYGRYLRPLRHHVVARLERFVPLLAWASTLSNVLSGSALTRLVGLVAVPRLSGYNLSRGIKKRGVEIATPARLAQIPVGQRSRHVVIVPDAFTLYYDTPVLCATFDLLIKLGFRPWLAPYAANGKPLHVHGFLNAFEKLVRRNARDLQALHECGVALVGIDPSMTLTYRSEYPAAAPDVKIPRVHMLQEWLAPQLGAVDARARAKTFVLLPHCSERATAPQGIAAWQKVFEAMGLQLAVPPAGCCGMAGTFGHEAENRALSEKIYAMSWAKHVQRPDASMTLLADGFSCRCQAKLVDKVNLRHPVQVLNEMLGDNRHS